MLKSSLALERKAITLVKQISMFAMCIVAAVASSSSIQGQSPESPTSPFNLVNDLGGILSLEGVSNTGIGEIDRSFLNTQPVSQITFAPGVNDQVYVSTQLTASSMTKRETPQMALWGLRFIETQMV